MGLVILGNLLLPLQAHAINGAACTPTRAERLSTLLSVVSVAFIWSAVTGDLLAALTKVKIKSHGHRTVSVFRLGLDHLQDPLLHPSPSSRHILTTLMPRFEG